MSKSTKLYVMTCPRGGGVSYLGHTLRQANAQPWEGERVVWSDGELDRKLVPDGWRIEERPRRGPPNTHAFWELLADAAGADALVLEDDLELSPGFLPYAARIGCPSPLAYVSWFDPLTQRRSINVQFGLLVDAQALLPAQARTWPARTIDLLLKAGPGPNPSAGLDACAAAALGGLLAGVHVPSGVQHRGLLSSVNPGLGLTDDRISQSWLGNTVDVDRVFARARPETVFPVASLAGLDD
jgi:hypothetical protein